MHSLGSVDEKLSSADDSIFQSCSNVAMTFESASRSCRHKETLVWENP
jgi:hypothetical protein